MDKLLTVVTSTYNKGDRNRASIQSILDQTFTDFDYIVVNDSSPDNTKEILEEFNDPRLKIIHQENKGFVKTMISVMNQIKTPYAALQGAGDISLPERFSEQIRYLESRPEVAVVSCSTYETSTLKSNYLQKVRERAKKIRYKSRIDIEYNTVEQMIENNIVDHGDVMIRMPAYQDAGGYRPFFRYCQDRDLWLRILEKHSIVRLRQELYVKVVDPRFDIAGNPGKAERQSLYSLFSRHLARERKLTGIDPLECKGESAFADYIENLDDSSKLEISTKAFRNTLRSRLEKEDIDTAHEIIYKYMSNHPLNILVSTLRFMKENIPFGAEIFRGYYYQIQKRTVKLKSKFSRLNRRLFQSN
ncbi:MAG: glycosyltransferase [Verrucomicrobiota bacterium]